MKCVEEMSLQIVPSLKETNKFIVHKYKALLCNKSLFITKNSTIKLAWVKMLVHGCMEPIKLNDGNCLFPCPYMKQNKDCLLLSLRKRWYSKTLAF